MLNQFRESQLYCKSNESLNYSYFFSTIFQVSLFWQRCLMALSKHREFIMRLNLLPQPFIIWSQRSIEGSRSYCNLCKTISMQCIQMPNLW